ncbi:MAG TPA: hypothetical protein VFQ92_14625 [Blastocatellia bacterium]|nr:hypothetical protein [Blastocatellia bacterium]
MVALFVVLTIVLCVAVDSIVQWRKSRNEEEARQLANRLAPTYEFEKVSAPSDVFLDTGHTWVHVAPTGRADVGLDSFAQKIIGRIDAVVLPEVGKEVHRGDMLFAVCQGNRRAAFASPVDGIVTSVDKNLAWHPETIQSDPYNEGWVCSLAPRNLSQDLKQLRLADDANTWLKDELYRFQEFFAARPLDDTKLGQVLQNGGRPDGGVLELMDEATWKQFNEVFLRPQSGATIH